MPWKRKILIFRAMMKSLAYGLMALWLTALPAQAQDYVSTFETENVAGSLYPAQETFVPGQSFWVALQLDIREGWHTYWRNSGDSGMPTSIRWDLPEGFSAGDIVWQTPKRIAYGPLMNFGFYGTAMHLVEITPPANLADGTSVTFNADTTWLVCEEICIPEDGTFSFTMTADSGAETEMTPYRFLIEKALNDLPVESPWDATFDIQDKSFELSLFGAFDPSADIRDVAFFPDAYGVIENALPQELDLSPNGLTLTVPTGYDPSAAGDRLTGVLTLVEDTGDGPVTLAFEIDAPRAAAPVPSQAQAPAAFADVSLLTALALAFIGGLILNLMPCVLPVLAMKAVAFAGKSDADKSELRGHGLAYTGGVLVTFALLAGALIALRAAGDVVGWGFQLQSPIVIAILAYVLLAVGLNLSGVFEIGGSLQNIGSGVAGRSDKVGSFATGALAVVVATPCTAPFMVTALGYAMIQPPAISMVIFMALGLGLAAPYLLLSFSPAAVRLMPKPGTWMVRLKQLLAFPMYGSVAWLIWVLSQQVGPEGMAAALAGLVVLGFAAWLLSLPSSGLTQKASLVAALVLMVVALGAVRGSGPAAVADSGAAPDGPVAWTTYAPDSLNDLTTAGEPVFINLTAAWCITCKVNERVALSSETIGAAAEAAGITLMKGDWTNRNAEISALLDEFGRAGVPLYLLYRRDGSVDVLPQVLTEGLVLDAFGSV